MKTALQEKIAFRIGASLRDEFKKTHLCRAGSAPPGVIRWNLFFKSEDSLVSEHDIHVNTYVDSDGRIAGWDVYTHLCDICKLAPHSEVTDSKGNVLENHTYKSVFWDYIVRSQKVLKALGEYP